MVSVESLLLEITRIGASLEFWKTCRLFVIAGTAILAVATMAAQWMEMRRSGELAAAQKELIKLKDEQLRVDLADKDVRIADANHLGSKANERAAKAEQKSAEANLALAIYKAPRFLTDEQRERIVSKLKHFNNIPFDIAVSSGAEALSLTDQIEDVLRKTNWNQLSWDSGSIISRRYKANLGSVVQTGVFIYAGLPGLGDGDLNPVARALASALKDEGIMAEPSFLVKSPSNNKNALHIVIGEKPK